MKPIRSTLLKVLACAALLSVPAATSLAQASPGDAPLPGYWEYKYKVFGASAGDDMKCLTPKDVARFFDGLCKKDTKCTYTTNDAANGKVNLVGVWVDHKNRRTKVKANGVYNQTAFTLKANIVIAGILPVNGNIEGRRVNATCPAPTAAN
jgi:hypothetical protein